MPTARRSCSSPTTRPTSSGSSASPTPGRYVKDGINDCDRPRPARGREPRRTGDQGRGALSSRGAGRRRAWSCACGSRTRGRWSSARTGRSISSTRRLRYGCRRPTSSTPAIIPAHLSDDARSVMRQAFAGLLWSKQFYHYVVQRLARGRPGAAAPPPESRLTGRNHAGRICTTPTSSRCRTSGSTRGTRRGTSRSTASPLALVDPEFAKEQLGCCCASGTCTRTGRCPRTNGSSAT